MINNFQITENFNLQEFECTHPEHRHVQVDTRLVNLLQKLRTKLGLPIWIQSGYRCPERNKEVGGADNSQHLFGRAADISLTNMSKSSGEVANIAKGIGFTGIGLYNLFLHLDVRKVETPVIWDRRE